MTLRILGNVVLQRLHRPYASMNWIRFNGSLRCHQSTAQQYLSPLPGHPW